MAMNPMQRKSKNSFLLGMLVTMILAGGVMAFLIFQMKEINKKMAYAESGSVYVLSQDVKSGQIITSDMLTKIKMNPKMTPVNSQEVMSLFTNDYLVDQNGNRIYGDAESGLYYEDSSGNQVNIFNGTDGKYYVKNGNSNVEVQVSGVPVIAKIDISANTAVTTDMLTLRENAINKDVRLEEYNMLKLPSTLENGDYIDVRITLPTGQDYIVISKKEVKRCSLTTVWLEVSEDEIATMSNAIIESYIMTGAQLYATRYVEPGLQVAATPTYPVSQAVNEAIKANPNILSDVLAAYQARINASARQAIESELSKYAADKKDNVETGVEESALKALESRTEYIDTLNVN